MQLTKKKHYLSFSFENSIRTGFCGETEDEFADTLQVMRIVKYHMAFMFAYSMREVSLILCHRECCSKNDNRTTTTKNCLSRRTQIN